MVLTALPKLGGASIAVLRPISRSSICTPPPTDVRIGALVVARQRPGTAKGITFMLIQESTEDAWSVIARRAERSTSWQHALREGRPDRGPEPKPRRDCRNPRIRCRNPLGNAHRALSPASTGVLGG